MKKKQEKNKRKMTQENKELLSFYGYLREQGWIWGPEPEIYQSMPGHYTYGPMGKGLKNELEKYIRKKLGEYEYEEIETPLIYPKIVWDNSGHWDKFQDPVVMTVSGQCIRLDKIIEEKIPGVTFTEMSIEEINKNLTELNKKQKDDPYILIDEIKYRNLMMTTYSGSNICALRPETATTTYTSFGSMYQYMNKKLPIGLYQIGKAFRNEINPRQNILRGREFTQAEAHVFLNPEQKLSCIYYEQNKHKTLPIVKNNFITVLSLEECLSLGLMKTPYYLWTVYLAYSIVSSIIPQDKIRLRQHAEDEKAFYALDAWDIEINITSIGWTEVCGIHDRGDYDLKQHKYSLSPIPHILEVAFGVDRLVFSLLDLHRSVKTKDQGKSILSLPYFLSPIKVAILPLTKNNSLIHQRSLEIYRSIKSHFPSLFNDKHSIGKRYLKSSQKAIPFCITIDETTLIDQTITLRDRDSEQQIRISQSDLISWLYSHISSL